jgi:flagellar FliL protein
MAKNAAKQETRITPIAEAKPKKKSRLLKIVIALMVLAGGAGAAWYAMEKPAATPNGAVPREKSPSFVPLESFTVNLQPENGDQYLQVGLVLKVTESTTGDAVKLYMPEIRNRILLLLSSKKASEVSTVAGKQRLSAEIMGEARQPIPSQEIQQGIVGVFFTSFVIQ